MAAIRQGNSAQDRTLNAKYVISCARKLGCLVFLLHEDIVDVKPKMLLVFVATVMAYSHGIAKEEGHIAARVVSMTGQL